MSYPVSQYRKQVQAGNVEAIKRPVPTPITRPVPANDNNPVPANDNRPVVAPKTQTHVPSWPVAKTITRGIKRYSILGWYDFIHDVLEIVHLTQTALIQVGGAWVFNRNCGRAGPVTAMSWGGGGNLGASCLVLQQPSTQSPLWSAIPPTATSLRFSEPYFAGVAQGIRYRTYDTYTRPPAVYPDDYLNIRPYWFLPHVNPRPFAPPGVPVGRPIPGRPRPIPRRPPPLPGDVPIPEMPGDPVRNPYGNPQGKPVNRSVTITETQTYNQVKAVPRGNPKRGEKERKVKPNVPGVFLVMQKIAHSTTEFVDFVDAIWKALPDEIQYQVAEKAPPQAKMDLIYREFDKVDLNEALKNLVINHITDKVIGRANKSVKKWATDNGITLGPYGLGSRNL